MSLYDTLGMEDAMVVLGLQGAFSIRHHDASACVMIDGRPVSLCEEERYLRQKCAWGRLPEHSIHAALKTARVTWDDVTHVAVPGITYPGAADRWRRYLTHLFGSCPKVVAVHHQMAHAACAFYGSGWDNGLVISLDGAGDGDSGVICRGEEGSLRKIDYIAVEESLGAFYTTMTQFLGFDDGDEYKLMGLAPYGRTPSKGGSFEGPWPNAWGRMRTPFEPNYVVETLKPRQPGSEITQWHKDFAASVQERFEDVLEVFMKRWQYLTGETRLAYAGGCALNCKANARLLPMFEQVYVSPVAGDRGLSLGAAYLVSKESGVIPRPLLTPCLGQDYSNVEIKKELDANGVSYQALIDPGMEAAKRLHLGEVIGWFQGRSEAGARALGNRSILARADLPDMKQRVNERIKFREEFRPFAPVVLDTEYDDCFEPGGTPWMTVAVKAGKHGLTFPATTHVDGTSRVQVLRHSDNPRLYSLIRQYQSIDGDAGILLNTSFNLKGQPIVESPRDALMTFFGCGLDALFIGDFMVKK